MSFRSFVAVLGCVAAFGSTSAAAQLAPGLSGKSTVTQFSGQEALENLVFFGRCYAEEAQANSLRLIATEPSSLEEAKVYKSIFSKTVPCMGGASTMRASLAMVRGVIAEGLYRKQIPLPAELALTSPEPAEVRNLAGAARCYVGRHRQQARDLVEKTKPGTPGEREAINALLPNFQQCVPAGAKSGFNASVVRFRIAEALYRTSGASSATQTQ